jgi:hypothetical protein
MMQNYQHELVNLHREQLLRDAEKGRLAQQVQDSNERSSAFNIAVAELGRQMVNVGQRLQEMGAPQPDLQPKLR